jgi:hypothetical protein
MTHLSKRGVPTWQEQLATSRQKKQGTAARALKKEKYTVRLHSPEPIRGGANGAFWYISYMPSQDIWLSEEEATLWRIKGYYVTPYENPITFKTRFDLETGH